MINLSRAAISLLVFLVQLSTIFLPNFSFAADKININTAQAKELERIIGIGPVLAQRIIEARPFYSLDELEKVDGIGPKKIDDIKKQGLAWVDPDLKPPEKETKPLETEIAKISEPFESDNKIMKKPFPPFIFAAIIAFFSAIIILILKRKINNID